MNEVSAQIAAAGVTSEDIVASMEMILGRTPDKGLIDYHLALGFEDRFALGRYMLSTQEFADRWRYRGRQAIFLGDRVLGYTHRGEPIYLVPNDLDVTPKIIFNGLFEPHVERIVRGAVGMGHVAVDIGTNVGYHSLVIGHAVGDNGKMYAFEANPDVAQLFKATMVLNGLTSFRGTGRVDVHQMAVADRAGTLILEQAPGHFGSGHLVTDAPQSDFGEEYSKRVEVPTVALDSFLADVPKIDFLHMDIEGAEPLAIRGARDLIARSPTLRIINEWSPHMMRTLSDLDSHIAWLVQQEFRFWLITHDGLQPVADADLAGMPHCDLFMSRQDPPAF
jgi:FkbM family methyltransferase